MLDACILVGFGMMINAAGLKHPVLLWSLFTVYPAGLLIVSAVLIFAFIVFHFINVEMIFALTLFCSAIALYFLAFESSHLAATPGKLIMGLSVKSTGGGASPADALKRLMWKCLLGLPLGVGYLPASVSNGWYTLYDLVSSTKVSCKNSRGSRRLVNNLATAVLALVFSFGTFYWLSTRIDATTLCSRVSDPLGFGSSAVDCRSVFSPREKQIHCLVSISCNIGSHVSAHWIAEDVKGIQPGKVLAERDVRFDSRGQANVIVQNRDGFAAGRYRLDLQVDPENPIQKLRSPRRVIVTMSESAPIYDEVAVSRQ